MLDTVCNVEVSNNTFIGSSSVAAYYYDVVKWCNITDNYFEGTGAGASKAVLLHKEAGKSDCNNITIKRNVFSDFANGIYIEGANDTTVASNAFINSTKAAIRDYGGRTILAHDHNFTYGSDFPGVIETSWGYTEFNNGMQLWIGGGGDILVNITLIAQDANSIKWDTLNGGLNYLVTNLSNDHGYKVYQDGVVIATGVGPTLSFTATGGGNFTVEVWYSSEVSSMIVLTVNMVGLGILVSVIAGWVMPFSRAIKKGTYTNANQMMKELIRGFIFIVVALIMWVMLHNIAIG
jgi:parallel beta-helix repeat protein